MIDVMVQGIKDRIEFYPFKEGLRSVDLPVGQGWDAIVDRLTAFRLKEKDSEAFDRKLSDLITQIILCSKKTFSFFSFDEDELANISKTIATQIDVIEFNNAAEMLNKSADIATETPEFAFKFDDSTMVFISKRKQEFRVDIPVVNQDVKDFLGTQNLNTSSKLVAFNTVERLCFDFVRVCPDRGTLEIVVDYGSEMKPLDRHRAESMIRKKAAALLNVDLPEPVNLFPAITDIYELPQGVAYKIVELGFITDDDYSHRVTGRGRIEPRDVREDNYHIAGSKDEEIYPYLVGIQVVVGNYKKAELMLKSTSSMVQSTKLNTLTCAHVLNCFSFTQLERCLSYLNSSFEDENVESTAA